MVSVETVLLCDKVTRDGQGKAHIEGVFDTIHVLSLPGTLEKGCIYVSGMGPLGSYPVELTIIDPQDKVITAAQMNIDIRKGDPTGRYELIVELLNMPLPSAGSYQLRVRTDSLEKSAHFGVQEADIKTDFTEEEAERISRDPTLIDSVKACVSCPECGTEYAFVRSLNKAYKYAPSEMPFPDSLRYECPTCGRFTFDLRQPYRQAIALLGTRAPSRQPNPRKDGSDAKSIDRGAEERSSAS